MKALPLILFGALFWIAMTAAASAAAEFTIKPRYVRTLPEALNLKSTATVLHGKGIPISTCAPLVRFLGESLQQVDVRPVETSPIPTPLILAGLPQDHPLLGELRSRVKLQTPAAGLGEEGFALDITPQRILVVGDAPAGVFYGMHHLADMAEAADGAVRFACQTAADWPLLQRRGFHILAVSREGMPAIEKLLTDILPHRRVNALIFEINYNFRFRSHPEVSSPTSFTLEDCRRVLQLARENHITIIPQLNCLGHQSWAGEPLGLLKAYPHFDETHGMPEEFQRPRPHCWCPSNPQIMPVVLDMIDELIDAFEALEFHCGMDETFYIGKCEKCRDTPPSELFARVARELHTHITEKRGVQMLIWGDRLLDAGQFGYSEWEGSANNTHDAATMIPTDIIICDWHYGERPDFPSIPYLQKLGFRVWPTGWNTRENARNLAGYALQHNTNGRLIGYMASSWTSLLPLHAAFNGDPEALEVPNVRGVVEATNTGLVIAWSGRL